MTTLREAAQQALEALLRVQPQVRGAIPVQDVEEAISALRAALAEPVQEPVAWRHKSSGHFTTSPLVSKFSEWLPLYTHPAMQRQPPQQTHNEECYQWHHECAIAEVKRLRAAPPKLAREPSAWLYYDPTTKRVFASEKELLFPVMAPLYMNDEAN